MLFKMEVTCSISVLNPVSASAQLLEQTARLQNLSTALDKLKVITSESSILCKMLIEQNQTFAHLSCLFQGEVAEHVVSYQPGAKASSDFATFPVSSFVKVNPHRVLYFSSFVIKLLYLFRK